MKILQISKYPPIQGGVSAECFWLAQTLSELGHSILVLTNSEEVEPEYKVEWTDVDKAFCDKRRGDHPVIVVSTVHDDNHYYIPRGTPIVSKLVSKGLELIADFKPDFIFSSYLEPYGVAGAFLSAVTGIPHATTHAGSDVGRLMKTDGLAKCYEMIFQRACAVVTNRGDELGILPEKRVPVQSVRLRPELFYPKPRSSNGTIVLGVYGKVGRQKGTSELLTVTSRLIAKGMNIELRCLWGGKGMGAVMQTISSLGLERDVHVSSFVPHWRVPEFIWGCDAIMFLENNFPILEHYPLVPLEALACGRPVLMTSEIARKGIYRRLHEERCLCVIPSPFTLDSLEISLSDLLQKLPSLQSRALTAFDAHFRNESAIWRTGERFDQILKLCGCDGASGSHRI